MDRISALRNVEQALAAFEEGEADLADLERRVRGVLRTYTTEFEGELSAYRASGDSRVAGMVVLATGEQQARERVRELVDTEGERTDDAFAVEPVDSADLS
jgi:exonuclease VII small subunit